MEVRLVDLLLFSQNFENKNLKNLRDIYYVLDGVVFWKEVELEKYQNKNVIEILTNYTNQKKIVLDEIAETPGFTAEINETLIYFNGKLSIIYIV